MNEYRRLTKEEFCAISSILTKCGIHDPSSVFRFVDTGLDKIYDVYLLDNGVKSVLKKTQASSMEADIYKRYFEGQGFAVPKILNTFSVGHDHFVQIAFIDGADARGCSKTDGMRIGAALADIQSHYLTVGGRTDKAQSYFHKQVAKHIDTVRPYYKDYSAVLSYVEKRFFEAPQTLIHEDFLPINVLVDNENVRIIDWEYADILPYFLDLARFAFVYDMENRFFIPQETADAFLKSYYHHMAKHPEFLITEEQFRLDIAVSAFCQYVMFLSCALNSQDAPAVDQCVECIDAIYFKEILKHIQSLI